MARQDKKTYELTETTAQENLLDSRGRQLHRWTNKRIDIFGNDTMTLVPVNVG